jgi:amino acid transporter
VSERRTGRELVAIILAAGFTIGTIMLSAATIYAALNNQTDLASDTSRVLTAVMGGMIGLLGAYLGFRRTPDGTGEIPDTPESLPQRTGTISRPSIDT